MTHNCNGSICENPGARASNGHGNNNQVSNEYVLNVAFFSFLAFVACQFTFAIMAQSQAMIADCEAMCVDAMTYMFNMCAERFKNRPIIAESAADGRELSLAEREHKRNLQRLYLELFPPMVSVACLIGVTVSTLQEAGQSLWGKHDDGEDDEGQVSIKIMLVFSALNLLLDIVNVSCFARAKMNFGLDVVRKEAQDIQYSVRRRLSGDLGATPTETSSLLVVPVEQCSDSGSLVNLNMCSAWTHVCADTLRSTAVLIAAAIAFVFPVIPPESADSVAAIIVSAIIFVSLVPLVQGLCLTAIEIYRITRNPPTSAFV